MNDQLTPLSKGNSPHGNHILFWWAVWCIIGISVPVSLKLAGIASVWADALKQWLIQPPFSMMERAFIPAPLGLFCFGVGVTMFFTWAVMHLESFLQRILVLVAGAVSILLFIPVCALWQIFFNTTGTVLALLVSGLGASITCLLIKRRQGEKPFSKDDEAS